MAFMNWTETIGQVMTLGTTNVTGDAFLTFLVVLMFLWAFSVMFGMQLRYTLIITFPLVLVLMAFYNPFVGLGVTIVLIFAYMLTKHLLWGNV